MTHLKYLWRTLLVKFQNNFAGMQFWNNLITGGTRVLAFYEMFLDFYSFVNRFFLWGSWSLSLRYILIGCASLSRQKQTKNASLLFSLFFLFNFFKQ